MGTDFGEAALAPKRDHADEMSLFHHGLGPVALLGRLVPVDLPGDEPHVDASQLPEPCHDVARAAPGSQVPFVGGGLDDVAPLHREEFQLSTISDAHRDFVAMGTLDGELGADFGRGRGMAVRRSHPCDRRSWQEHGRDRGGRERRWLFASLGQSI
jgi:hypothetical protein